MSLSEVIRAATREMGEFLLGTEAWRSHRRMQAQLSEFSSTSHYMHDELQRSRDIGENAIRFKVGIAAAEGFCYYLHEAVSHPLGKETIEGIMKIGFGSAVLIYALGWLHRFHLSSIVENLKGNLIDAAQVELDLASLAYKRFVQ